MAGVACAGGLETTCGVCRQAHFMQRGAKIIVGIGEFWLKTDRLAVAGGGVFGSALQIQHQT